MPRRKMREKNQLLKDRAKISQMILESYTYFEIAKTLGLSDSQVNHDIQFIKRQWRRETAEAIELHKEREFSKLKHLENVNWNEFEKSKIRVFVEKETGKPIPVEVPGDPKYLQNIENCIYKRMRLLGLEAPQKVDVKGTIEQKSELVIEVRHIDIQERIAWIENDLQPSDKAAIDSLISRRPKG